MSHGIERLMKPRLYKVCSNVFKPQPKKLVIDQIQWMKQCHEKNISSGVTVRYIENGSSEEAFTYRDIRNLNENPGPRCGNKYLLEIDQIEVLLEKNLNRHERLGVGLVDSLTGVQMYYREIHRSYGCVNKRANKGLLSFLVHPDIRFNGCKPVQS